MKQEAKISEWEKVKRRAKYRFSKDLGFSAEEARKMKDKTFKNIRKLLREKRRRLQ
ncbi:MAG: hypothetical protein MRK01_01650 [Candidatus Scalindua sp.]|nr:hypothetical protein [Candidatus Scalindua sp.]